MVGGSKERSAMHCFERFAHRIEAYQERAAVGGMIDRARNFVPAVP